MSNATFRVEGDLIIYGDLILNDGAKLEFIGDNSRVYITGSVNQSNTAVVSGDFEDLNNKF